MHIVWPICRASIRLPSDQGVWLVQLRPPPPHLRLFLSKEPLAGYETGDARALAALLAFFPYPSREQRAGGGGFRITHCE